jgi:ADP-heptose:LPS heptosyltransferase
MYCSPILRPAPTRLPTPLRHWLGRRLSGPPGGPRPAPRPACLYAVGHLGDFVHLLATVRLLLAEYGEADCLLVLSPAAAPLARREFPLTPLLELPPDGAGLFRDVMPAWRRHRSRFRGLHFARRIILRHQRSLYHEVTASWISADRDFRLEPRNYPAVPAPDCGTELLAHHRLAETVLGRPLVRAAILPSFTSVPLGDDGRLLVYPLSRDPSRCLRPEHVTAALRRWRERSRAPVVLGGAPSDGPALQRYAAHAAQAGLTGIAIELPDGVDGFLAHLATAGAILTTETAAVHVATALDKPTAVLLGGGFHGLVYPWRRSSRQVVVSHPLPCFGCGWHCTEPSVYCVDRLAPEAAGDALPAL